jgi:alpha-galactosidase
MRVTGLKPELRGIIARRLAPVETTVRAALEGDRKLWAEAMLLDGAVTDVSTADKIVEDFIEEFGEYLPQYR